MMTYYYLWNKMSILKGQIYVLESKTRDGTISEGQTERLIELELEHKYLEMLESIWDKHGENGFDGYEPKPEFVNEQHQIKKAS